MSSDLEEIRDDLRSVARDLLRKTRGTDWRLLATSGWLGLEVPETIDGAGATFGEIAVILEEMGRVAASCPYLGTVVLGAGALNLLEPNPGRDELLREIANGSVLVTVALATDDPAGRDVAPFRIERSTNGFRVSGEATFVPDAADVDRLLLLALDPDVVPVIVHVERDRPGLRVTGRPLLDETRGLGDITADGIEVSEAAVWSFSSDADPPVRRLVDRAAVAVACDSFGVSEAMLDATVAYAAVRQQFGRPIGSFQAVKHACADMLVQISIARELLAAAVLAIARDDPDATATASMAKSFVCDAAMDVVGKALQLHGGIGYTWESGVHVYLKRAALNRSLFGSPATHRRRLADRFIGVA